jgi:hypothetical protein
MVEALGYRIDLLVVAMFMAARRWLDWARR